MSYNNSSNSSSASDGQEISPFTIIYTLGEVVSQLCLIIIIFTYTITKRRKSTSGRLMINFCLSLLLLYIESSLNTFISASGSDFGCVIIGVCGHVVFLAMLTGLATYSLWIYLKLVWIFKDEPKHYTIKSALITWVAPLTVALISVSSDYSQYHKTKHLLICQATGYVFYIGTLLPAIILLLFSSVVMVLTLVHIYRSRNNQAIQSQTEEMIALTVKLKRKTKLFLCLLIMVVLGWGAAIIASDENTPTSILIIAFIVYLTCGFGQGMYLFLFVCVFSASVRKDWKNMASNVMHFSFSSTNNTSSTTDQTKEV